MVYADVEAGSERAESLIAVLDQQGIRAWNLGARLRFVTSMLVNRSDCERAVEAVVIAMAQR